jgi:hypothetical protein
MALRFPCLSRGTCIPMISRTVSVYNCLSAALPPRTIAIPATDERWLSRYRERELCAVRSTASVPILGSLLLD